MSTKVLQGAAKQKEAEKVLKQQKPLLVLFFMHGCPHCQANEKAWKEAKKKVGGNVTVAEMDENATPASSGVASFPTMKYITEGGEERSISGQRQSGDQILAELGVQKGSRRRRSTRGRRHTRNRKLRYRTLRNHVALA
jgi:hypothetical protein